MPDKDLTQLVRSLTPAGLRIYRQQLQALPERERQLAYSRLSGIPELADILGTPSPVETETPKTKTTPTQEAPLWQKALSTATAPLRWIEENVTQPFGAIVASPFTPAVPGTEGQNWLRRELSEYRQWKEPVWLTTPWGYQLKPTKGILETLPWFAVPSAAGVAGRLAGVAAKGGEIGRAAELLGKAISPAVKAEKIISYPISKPLEMLSSKLGGKSLSKLAGEVSRLHNAEGGATWNIEQGNLVGKAAYAVSAFPERNVALDTQKVTSKQISDFVKKNADIFAREKDVSVGSWFNPETGKTELDVVLTLPDKAKALDVANKFGQEAIYGLEKGETIYAPPQTAQKLIHYGKPNQKTISPEFMGTGQSGSEAKFFKEYKPFFKEGGFAKRSYYYTPEQTVEPRFKGGNAYEIETPLRVFDPETASLEEISRFNAKSAAMLEGFRKEFGENFGNLPEQLTEVQYAAAKELGYDATNTGKHVAVFRELPTKASELAQKGGEHAVKATAGNLSAEKEATGQFWESTAVPDRVALAKAAGLEGKVGSKAWNDMSVFEQEAVVLGSKNPVTVTPTEGIINVEAASYRWDDLLAHQKDKLRNIGITANRWNKASFNERRSLITGDVGTSSEIADRIITQTSGAPPKTPIPPTKIISEIYPEGFDVSQEAAIKTLIAAVKEAKPVRKTVESIYTKARAEQAASYEARLEQLTTQGLPPSEALAEAEKALYTGGKLPVGTATTQQFTSIADKVSQDAGETLFGIIQDASYKSAFDRINTRQALARLLDPAGAGMPREFELKLLEKTFGSDLVKAVLDKRGLMSKLREWTTDILNMPRALLASCDISGLLRQGGILVARHPLEGAKSVEPMLKAMFSDKNTLLMDNLIRSRTGMEELLDESLRIPLYMAPIPSKVSVTLAEREEAFMSALINKIYFVKASNRAYVSGLNDLRSRSALNVLNAWKKAGIKYTKDDLSDLNQLINWASGRGTLPSAVSRQGALLNTMLFSPKLIMSRLEFPTAVLPMVTQSALVRKEAWKTLGSFVGAGAGILSMAKLSGAADKVELDPRSADFGKIVVGDVRLDIWTGYLQYLRFTAQLATAQRKSTTSGRIIQLNRKDVLDRFTQTKLSPAVGLVNDLLKGETYLGEELPPKSAKSTLGQLYQRMMPLAIQDLVDGVNQDGLLGGIVSSAGILGVGVVTYTDELALARNKAAKAKYGLTWDELGRQYGQAAQLRLEQTSKDLQAAEQENDKRFAAGTPSIMEDFTHAGDAIEETYRKLVNQAAEEFRATADGVTFKDKVDAAAQYRRNAYGARATRPEFQDIIAYYQQPIKPEAAQEMNPGDVLRREYYRIMYSPDMYDQFGNYRFDEAEKREQQFVVQHGQQALDYIDEYRSSRWLDQPPEMQMLKNAREALRPYWEIADRIWSMYPPELKAMSDQIQLMERTDPQQAARTLRRYPQILRARALIAQYRKQMRERNPIVNQAYKLFYTY